MTIDDSRMVRVMRGAARIQELLDWGPIAARSGTDPASAVSRTRGALLYKGPAGAPEAGVWECTPGAWECRVARDEFCHFLAGRCVYTHDSGERTELGAGDAAFFPAGWSGRCEVNETVRKVYVIL